MIALYGAGQDYPSILTLFIVWSVVLGVSCRPAALLLPPCRLPRAPPPCCMAGPLLRSALREAPGLHAAPFYSNVRPAKT